MVYGNYDSWLGTLPTCGTDFGTHGKSYSESAPPDSTGQKEPKPTSETRGLLSYEGRWNSRQGSRSSEPRTDLP